MSSPQRPGTKRKSLLRVSLLAPASVATCVLVLQAHTAAQDYLIEESTDYTSNGCESDGIGDVNAVTSSLRTALEADSWSGNRFLNPNSWPHDVIEACASSYGIGGTTPNGLDSTFADTRTLVVFAGHGNQGRLTFGFPHNGSNCRVYMEPNMRLGSMAGNDAAYGMWLSSITLKVSALPDGPNWQWLRQQFGFNNSPSIGANEPRDFFNATSSADNSDAWLNQMDGNGREPVVLTHSTTESACWALHDSARLKADVTLTPRPGGPACEAGQPAFYHCYEWIDL